MHIPTHIIAKPNGRGQATSVLEEAWAPEYTYIGIIIDTDIIQKPQVSVL